MVAEDGWTAPAGMAQHPSDMRAHRWRSDRRDQCRAPREQTHLARRTCGSTAICTMRMTAHTKGPETESKGGFACGLSGAHAVHGTEGEWARRTMCSPRLTPARW